MKDFRVIKDFFEKYPLLRWLVFYLFLLPLCAIVIGFWISLFFLIDLDLSHTQGHLVFKREWIYDPQDSIGERIFFLFLYLFFFLFGSLALFMQGSKLTQYINRDLSRIIKPRYSYPLSLLGSLASGAIFIGIITNRQYQF